MRYWRKLTWTLWILTLGAIIWAMVLETLDANKMNILEATLPAQCRHALHHTAAYCANWVPMQIYTTGINEDYVTGMDQLLLLAGWFMLFVPLLLIWLVTRPLRYYCPNCGKRLRIHQRTCARCGLLIRLQSYVRA